MNRKRHVDALLRGQTDTRRYVLGTEFLNDEQNCIPTGKQAMALRYRAARVGLSFNSDDQQAASQINYAFREKDAHLAEYELDTLLRRPITERTKIMLWLAGAPRIDIETFCKWNLRRTTKLQAALNRDKGRLCGNVMDKTVKLTEDGLFPKGAPFLMEAALGRYGIQAMDTFYSGGKNANGMCLDDRIVLTNLYENRQAHQNPSDEMKRVVFHEYLHAVGNDRGFFHGIKTQVPVMRLFEEAFVEHATTVAYSREMIAHHMVDPLLHPASDHDLSVYRSERQLLSAIMEEQAITPEEVGEAFFTPMDSSRGDFLRTDLERKIGKFFLAERGLFDFNDQFEKSSYNGRRKIMDKLIGDAELRFQASTTLQGLQVTL